MSPAPSIKVPVSWMARLLRRASGSLTFQTIDGVDVPSINGHVIHRDDVARVEESQKVLWSNLTIHLTDGSRQTVCGLRKKDATLSADCIRIFGAAVVAGALIFEFDHPKSHSRYFGFKAFDDWMVRAKPVADAARQACARHQSHSADFATVAELVRIVDRSEEARAARNNFFVAAERALFRDRFAQAQGYPLNDDQINAILYNEDRALVVAGAGAGKTSTIVGKVDYLLTAGLARPEDLLLLAYGKKAAEEMRQRLLKLTGKDIAVLTFHALGLKVYAESTGQRPTLSKIAETNESLECALRTYIESMLESPDTRQKVIEFLAFHRYPLRTDDSFKSEHEKLQYAKGHDLRDLHGTQMKSVQETMIANWLLLNGIEYEYERPYEHPTASVQFRQYHPDFYLPKYGIYIEHFGIDRRGNPPRYFTDPQKYVEGIRWKRDLHKSKCTRLVETFSYESFEGTLFTSLEKSLRVYGVEFHDTDPNATLPLLRQSSGLSQFIKVIASFLKLFKGNIGTLASLRTRIAPGDLRGQKFLDLFEGVYQQYQAALTTEGAIDFEDMIIEATRFIQAGKWNVPYRYVIVDEFQDTSLGRAKLLQALLGQVPNSKLFCVGDDWQSIFRFTGSDIDVMTKFEAHFGRFRRTDLRQTHRFGSNLLKASSMFVMSNPQQLKKDLIAAHSDDGASIEVHSGSPGPDGSPDLTAVFDRIRLDAASQQSSPSGRIEVLLLGRYNLVNDRYSRHHHFPGLHIRTMTVHSAKGSESDYVILLDVIGGRHGFPTEMADDPLLDLVLAMRAPFPHAEERRLFYVALTRARRKTYIITHDTHRSVFVDEIESRRFAGLVIASGAAEKAIPCPRCGGGRLDRREGPFGKFYGCSNYPLCKGKAQSCPACGVGAFVKEGYEYVCHNQDCRIRRPACPSCGVGHLLVRKGPYGEFLGCSEWRSDLTLGSCKHTDNLRNKRQR